VKVNLKLDGSIEYINKYLKTDLTSLSKTYNKKLRSFLSVNNKRSHGWADTGSACGSLCGSNNIVSFDRTISKSKRDGTVARLWAHELGHTIGMKHDDKQGKTCGTNHLMQSTLFGYENTWSNCSNKNFETWYREKGHKCM